MKIPAPATLFRNYVAAGAPATQILENLRAFRNAGNPNAYFVTKGLRAFGTLISQQIAFQNITIWACIQIDHPPLVSRGKPKDFYFGCLLAFPLKPRREVQSRKESIHALAKHSLQALTCQRTWQSKVAFWIFLGGLP